jgi:hypothetical protein
MDKTEPKQPGYAENSKGRIINFPDPVSGQEVELFCVQSSGSKDRNAVEIVQLQPDIADMGMGDGAKQFSGMLDAINTARAWILENRPAIRIRLRERQKRLNSERRQVITNIRSAGEATRDWLEKK